MSWKTSRGPDRGITNVYIDGVLKHYFDGYLANFQANVTGYSTTSLTNGPHKKNSSSRGTYTEIDRFNYRDGAGTWSSWHDEDNSRVNYSPWTSFSSQNFRHFKGPEIKLITLKAGNAGTARVEVYDRATGALAASRNINLYSSGGIQWQVKESIADLYRSALLMA